MTKENKQKWGSVRSRGDDSFEIRYPTIRDNGLPGQRKSEYFKGTEKEAYARLDELHQQYLTRKKIMVELSSSKEVSDSSIKPTSSITVREVWEVFYLPTSEVAESTLAGYESHFRRNIAPVFGERPIVSITHSEIQKELKKKSYAVAKHMIAVLRLIWNTAEYENIIPRGCNIMKDKYKLAFNHNTQPSRAIKDIYSEEEINQIIDESDNPFITALVIVLGKGGLRVGEACGVRSDEIKYVTVDDMLWAVVSIERNALKVNGKLIIKEPKTKYSERKVVIPDPWASKLRAAVEELNDEWLLGDGCGRPLTSNPLGSIWKRYIMRTSHKYIPLKNFRNSCATAWRARGMSEGDAYTLLGHSNPLMLRTNYNRPRSKELIQTYSRYLTEREADTSNAQLQEALKEIERLQNELSFLKGA